MRDGFLTVIKKKRKQRTEQTDSISGSFPDDNSLLTVFRTAMDLHDCTCNSKVDKYKCMLTFHF